MFVPSLHLSVQSIWKGRGLKSCDLVSVILVSGSVVSGILVSGSNRDPCTSRQSEGRVGIQPLATDSVTCHMCHGA